MNTLPPADPALSHEAYYARASAWADDMDALRRRSGRLAWAVAGCALAIVAIQAVGLALMVSTPDRPPESHLLLVDRHTGQVTDLKDGQPMQLSADEALTQSLLAQYVIARESFDIATIRDQYRKVGLWSAGEARTAYLAAMAPGSPENPFRRMPRTAVLSVRVKSISRLDAATALVRFESTRDDAERTPADGGAFVAVLRYRFTRAPMALEDRLVNPLGLQVVQYRKDQEAVPVARDDDPPPRPESAAEMADGPTAAADSPPAAATPDPAAPRRPRTQLSDRHFPASPYRGGARAMENGQ